MDRSRRWGPPATPRCRSRPAGSGGSLAPTPSRATPMSTSTASRRPPSTCTRRRPPTSRTSTRSPGLTETAHTIRVVRTGTRNPASGGANIIVDAFVAPDLYPPAAPSGLRAVPEATGARATWTASAEDDVIGYRLYRQLGTTGTPTRVGDDPIPATSYLDTGLQPGTRYRYQVAALDAGGNESARSSWVSVTTTITLSATARTRTTPPGSPWPARGRTTSSSQDSGGSFATLGTTGYAEISFKTSGLKWLARTNAYAGIADVYLDGAKVTSVDLYSAGHGRTNRSCTRSPGSPRPITPSGWSGPTTATPTRPARTSSSTPSSRRTSTPPRRRPGRRRPRGHRREGHLERQPRAGRRRPTGSSAGRQHRVNSWSAAPHAADPDLHRPRSQARHPVPVPGRRTGHLGQPLSAVRRRIVDHPDQRPGGGDLREHLGPRSP